MNSIDEKKLFLSSLDGIKLSLTKKTNRNNNFYYKTSSVLNLSAGKYLYVTFTGLPEKER